MKLIVGSMNINGVSRLERDLGTSVKETLVEIFRATDIMAVQEIPSMSPQLDNELKTLHYDRASKKWPMSKTEKIPGRRRLHVSA